MRAEGLICEGGKDQVFSPPCDTAVCELKKEDHF